MVKNLVGPPVVGEDFVGRKEELAEAVRMISQGNSLLLASPRRVWASHPFLRNWLRCLGVRECWLHTLIFKV